ncbi:hypothetical protein CcaCcLH18_06778 [Colletotrichum camelliae]|nr:hypothetical protein CcaCcLH18_06778 [Colletotrichum camelliae]
MKFSMNAKLSVAIIGHFATRGAAQQRVKLTDGTDLPEPMLTTLLGDSIHKPIPTNGSGFTVMNSEVCRPITTTSCEWIQITSTMTSSEVMTTPMVATSEVSTSQVQTSVVNEETSSSSVASSTIGTTSGSTSAVMTPTASATGSVTPIPSSGADKTGAGLVAGLALLLVI